MAHGGADVAAKQGFHVFFVKHIFLLTKIASDLNAALFQQDLPHFLPAQQQQHIAHFFV